MSAIAILILVVLMIVALLIITLVLLQEEGGEGLGGIFGGGASQQMGSRGSNPLTRITAILGTIFIVSALSLGWLIRSSDVDNVEQAARELRGDNNEEILQWWQSLEQDDEEEIEDGSFLQDILENEDISQ